MWYLLINHSLTCTYIAELYCGSIEPYHSLISTTSVLLMLYAVYAYYFFQNRIYTFHPIFVLVPLMCPHHLFNKVYTKCPHQISVGQSPCLHYNCHPIDNAHHKSRLSSVIYHSPLDCVLSELCPHVPLSNNIPTSYGHYTYFVQTMLSMKNYCFKSNVQQSLPVNKNAPEYFGRMPKG